MQYSYQAFLTGGAPSAAFYTTSFAGTENPISEGGRWLNGGTDGLDWFDCSKTPGLAIGRQTSGHATDGHAVLTGTWPANQQVSAVVRSTLRNDTCFEEVEMRLRSTISAHVSSGYEISYALQATAANSYLIIVRWNGPVGSFDYLFNDTGATYVVNDGDTVSTTIVGNTINAYVNGVLKGTADITSIGGTVFATGNPGMGFNLENSIGGCPGKNGDYGYTSFTAQGL